MPKEKKVRQLSVFLIRSEYGSVDQVIRAEQCERAIEVPIAGYGAGQLFIKRTPPVPPKWTSIFADFVDVGSLVVPGVCAAFFISIKERCFVLTFGQGGRFLIKDNVCEERFGLRCALNSVDIKSFRCVDVQSLDAIQSHSRIQSGQETSPDQFGLDVEQDMLKAIVGTPVNPVLGHRMAGSDALSVNVKADLSDLPYLLDEYRKNFEADLSAEDYEWINNISMAKSEATIALLESLLDEKLLTKDFQKIWLAIPEIIDWTNVMGFAYTHGGKRVHADINFEGFCETVDPKISITLELLKNRRVSCVDENFRDTFKAWSVYRCLYAEVDCDGAKHILNDGKWFSVASNFVNKTDADFATIPRSNLKLPKYTGNGEGAYNASVAAAEPARYALLDDRQKVMHGGGHGQVEICDLLSIDRELIHLKIYGKSSVFSHLFAQGFVSGQLIRCDPDFRQKVRAKLVAPFIDLLSVDQKPEQDAFTITYAVISDSNDEDLYLPFFSRVNLNNTAKVLRGFGYKVEMLKIPYDEFHAKTIKVPPGRRAREH